MIKYGVSAVCIISTNKMEPNVHVLLFKCFSRGDASYQHHAGKYDRPRWGVDRRISNSIHESTVKECPLAWFVWSVSHVKHFLFSIFFLLFLPTVFEFFQVGSRSFRFFRFFLFFNSFPPFSTGLFLFPPFPKSFLTLSSVFFELFLVFPVSYEFFLHVPPVSTSYF